MGSKTLTILLDAASDIQEHANRERVPVRIAGSVAVRVHCPQSEGLLDRMGRPVPNDLDLVSEGRFHAIAERIFKQLGYEQDKRIALASDRQQFYFQHPVSGITVDLFMDRLNYCHPVVFRGLLNRDPNTIPLCELLLSKLQIVDLNEKDIIDATIILLEHEIGSSDTETINIDRAAHILAQDWGFYYTVTNNLNRLQHWAGDQVALDADARAKVLERARILRQRIEIEEKALRWKMRARVGARLKWYQEVEEK